MKFSFDDYIPSDNTEAFHTFLEPKSNISSPLKTPKQNVDNRITINEDSEIDDEIPKMQLPILIKTNSIEKVSQTPPKLEPRLVELIEGLNLSSKLPKNEETIDKSLYNLRFNTIGESNHTGNKNNNPVCKENVNLNPNSGNAEKLISIVSKFYQTKFENIDYDIKQYVQQIKSKKRQEEEERKRKERDAQKRKEEEERRHKEEEVKRLKEEQEKRKHEEEEAKKEAQAKAEAARKAELEEAKVKEQQNKAQQERAKYITNYSDIEKQFWFYKETIAKIKKEIVEPVKQADKDTRNILSRHKRKINPKFGQLTNTYTQLQAIEGELSNLINQTISSPLSYKWILNFIAKAIVHQAETEVRVKPESSLPLARLALMLLQRYTELKELLMARFVKKCPFVIGYTCDISTEKGRSNMGWKRNSNNKWEDATSYDERMAGITTLYAVITRLQSTNPGQPNPFPLTSSWQLLARIANLPTKLLTNTHFVILGAWWDAAALEFVQSYGKQGNKLLILIGDILTSSVADKKYVGAARLRILLEEWTTNRIIKSFPEMLH